jgi:hypothetical protein
VPSAPLLIAIRPRYAINEFLVNTVCLTEMAAALRWYEPALSEASTTGRESGNENKWLIPQLRVLKTLLACSPPLVATLSALPHLQPLEDTG